MKSKIKLLGVISCTIFVTILLLSGCEQQNQINESDGILSIKTPDKVKSVYTSKEALEKYLNKLHSLDSVFTSHHIKLLSSYSNNNKVFLEIRRIGDHYKSMSDKEISALKQSIYKAVGGEFPLSISVYSIGEQPEMIGKIRAIDYEGRFLVVSTDKFLDKEKKMPDAAWYTVSVQ